MDIVMHGTHGGIIRYLMFKSTWAFIIGFIEGILPDLIGYVEKIIKKDNKKWEWYVKIHLPLPAEYVGYVLFFQPIALHIFLDSFTHHKKKWWKELLWLEILLWVVTLFILYLIWRNNLWSL
jgi:hypothetical protein